MAEVSKLEEVVGMVKTYAGIIKTAVIAGAVCLGGWFVGHKAEGPKHDEGQQTPVAAAPVTFSPPAQAVPAMSYAMPQAPGASAGLTFTVGSSGQNASRGRKYLNSLADYRLPGNQSITLEGAAAAGINPASLVGRTVTGMGQIRNGKNGPYVVVTDPSQLRVQ